MATNGHATIETPSAIAGGLVVSADPTPAELIRLALSHGTVNADQLTKLMELYERWNANQARKAFVVAMNEFKTAPPRITKNKHVAFESKKEGVGPTNYDHATLDHVCEMVIGALSEHGISHRWEFEMPTSADWVKVTCILTHDLGHSEAASLYGPPDRTGNKSAVQSIASTVTMLERYTLLAATGLAAADTDTDGKTTMIAGDTKPALAASSADPFQARCTAIGSAKSIVELQTVFVEAYKSAVDEKQQTAFINVKDRRKKELSK